MDYATSVVGNTIANVDYTTTTGTLTIPAGQTSGAITVPVLGDTLDEVNDVFRVTLSNPVNGFIADPQGDATITDNDPEPTVAFTAASQSINEGTLVTATLQLSAASSLDVSIPFTASGTATAGTDYSSLTTSPITIPAGSSSVSVTFRASLDAVSDDGETVILTLGSPTYATAGSSATHTVILNNVVINPLVAKTGQTTCYDASGNNISCTGTRQDGELQKGVSWPSPRFTDNNNGTVTDNLTGLIWLKDANCSGQEMGRDATTSYVRGLANGSCGLSDGSVPGDWRLPENKEFISLIDLQAVSPPLSATHPFLNVKFPNFSYITGTVPLVGSQISAWAIHFTGGELMPAYGGAGSGYVWPIRSSFSHPVVLGLRFVDNGDGTILDNLTGLTWMKNTICFGYMHWDAALSKVADLNSGGATCSGYSGTHMDWRLPNILELESLVDYNQETPPFPVSHPFEPYASGDIGNRSYWSSTTQTLNPDAGTPSRRVARSLSTGGMSALSAHSKDGDLWVWPVRGGQ